MGINIVKLHVSKELRLVLQKQEAIGDHHVKRCTGSNISPHS